MPINPGDLAECRLGGATGEEHQAPPFVPGQDGVGTVLKACCQTHVHKSRSVRANCLFTTTCFDVQGKDTWACKSPKLIALMRPCAPVSLAGLPMSMGYIARNAA